jgi:hypothetical protein
VHGATGLRDDHFGDRPVDPGDRIEQVEPGPKGRHRLLDPLIQLLDRVGELVILVQMQAGQECVASGQGLGEFGDLPTPPRGPSRRQAPSAELVPDQC